MSIDTAHDLNKYHSFHKRSFFLHWPLVGIFQHFRSRFVSDANNRYLNPLLIDMLTFGIIEYWQKMATNGQSTGH